MASVSRTFPCNTCSLTFKTSELQRSHMRQPWHIYNLRQRIAGLPALSEEQYDTQAKSREITPRQEDNDEQRRIRMSSYIAEIESDSITEDIPQAENEISEKISPMQCLFCNLNPPTLDANIDHMSSLHGLLIPSVDHLSDMESFLGYLAIMIFEDHECLYCGLKKGSVEGVQTHMRDKGHCIININAESELLDFWELPSSGDEGPIEDEEHTKNAAVKLSDTEMRLPSGTIITSRSETTQLRAKPGLAQSRTKSSQYRTKRDGRRAITVRENQDTTGEQSGTSRSNDRRVAARGEMGLSGILDSQRRALQITEKKMKRREAVAKAAQRYVMEQEPIKTKYYKTEAPIYQAG